MSIKTVGWSATQLYSQYDITQGAVNGTSIANLPGPLYISTIPNNLGINPSGVTSYPIYAYSRAGEVATIYISTPGVTGHFSRGSQVGISGNVDTLMNHTGMITSAFVPPTGNWASVSFTNAGLDTSLTTTSLGRLSVNGLGAWTTGWLFSPSYATNLDMTNSVNKAQFEGNYQQRQTFGLNNNPLMVSLGYENRSDTEVKAMLAMEQYLGAVASTPIMLPVAKWYNRPNLKFVIGNIKLSPGSYGLTNVQASAVQVNES